jgi:hypothetical protein
MKRIIFLFSISLAMNSYSQNSLNGGLNFQTIGDRFLTGPTIGYSLSKGEKWSFIPTGFYHYGKLNEKVEFRDKNRYGTDVFSTIKIRTHIYGLSISLKRYLGKNSNNETGGFYLVGFVGFGYGVQNVTVPTFDTSLYEYVSSKAMNKGFPSGYNISNKLNRVTKAGYGVGYDYEITDLLFLFADGALELYTMDVHDIGLYVHIGIRKRFFKL